MSTGTFSEEPTCAGGVPLDEADGRTSPDDLGFDPNDLDKPLLVWDGACGFCRRSLEYVLERVGDAIYVAPYQHVHAHFDDIAEADFERAVHLVEPEGLVSSGADAIFRTLALAPDGGFGEWCYAKIPLFAPVSEAAYRWIAEHRPFVNRTTRRLVGEDLAPSNYRLARWLFLRLVGLVFLVAFVSLWVQLDGLVGSNGIAPAAEAMENLHRAAERSDDLVWQVPTLFWWMPPTDTALHAFCGAGVAASVGLLVGLWPRGMLGTTWLLYLSLAAVSSPWLGYQWDILMLEVAFLGLFVAPARWWAPRGGREPSRVGVFLFHWLAFRLMFMSGVVKLTSGDPVWRDGTALAYHFWTQPIPSWTSWWVDRLPDIVLQAGTWATLVIELGVPFLVFLPRKLRHLAAASFFLLQVAILATGNYGFFNILTMAVCVLLVADRVWESWLPDRVVAALDLSHEPVGWSASEKLKFVALVGVAGFVLLVTIPQMGTRFGLLGARDGAVAEVPDPVQQVVDAAGGFRTLNNYGLFADMTVRRPELVVQGSRDGENWRTYTFEWKPDGLEEMPRFVQPHQPRLDWQMWFQALRMQRTHDRTGKCGYNEWFIQFMRRLLQGEETVTALLHEAPFGDEPPEWVRTVVYDYEFAEPGSERWWSRSDRRSYCPPATLRSDGRIQFGRP